MIFHHIHKCGGTSLESILRQWYYYKREYALDKNIKLTSLKNFQCIGGHYGNNGYTLEKKYPGILDNHSFLILTYLREPLERAVSQFYHWRKNGYKELQDLSVDSYLKKNDNDWISHSSTNWMAYVLGCDENNYQEILDKYFFIGVFEEFETSTRILAKLLNKPFYDIPHKRKGQADKSLGDISENAKNAFKEKNKLDYLIYNYAFQRFQSIKEETATYN